MGRNRRRNYFIHKDFQSRFILRFVLTTTLWAVAAVVFFSYLAGKRLQEALYTTHLRVSTPGELLLSSTVAAHGMAILLFVLLLAYSIYRLRKKLSLPLYMLRKDLTRIAGGDLAAAVSLREEDEFQELASDMDAMRAALGRKLIALKAGHAALASAVSELQRAVLKGHSPAQQMDVLRKAVARMKEELNVFTH